MHAPVDRKQLELLARGKAELRRRQEKKLQAHRGWYDADGVRQGGLIAFVRYFWKVLEPETPLVDGWPIWAICEHLEAVSRGEITRLLMNVPPGFMKSLLTDVFWPAWEWGPMNMAHLRYVTFSYSATLTERDNNRFADLVSSAEYQALWRDRVTPIKTGAQRVTNNKKGWKLASSVGGVGTGERGDRILCVSGGTLLETEHGKLPISQIVASKNARFVLGYDHATNQPRWQKIAAYEANPIRPFVRLRFDGGELVCTADHPVYVVGRGYTEAQSVREGEKTLCVPTLCDMRQGMSSTLQHMQPRMQTQALHQAVSRAEHQALLGLRQADLSNAITLGAAQRRSVLQPCLSRWRQRRFGQSNVEWWSARSILQALRQIVYGKEAGSVTAHSLLNSMRWARFMGQWVACIQAFAAQAMRDLWQAVSTPPTEQVLFASMCGAGARQADARRWQWPIHSWSASATIRQWVDAKAEEGGSRARRLLLSFVRDNGSGAQGGTARPSYQLRQERYVDGQSDFTVPHLPRWDARRSRIAPTVVEKTIRAIEMFDTVEPTFNVCVEPNHNYFANGILTHNCDDPNNVKDAESLIVRTETVRWFRESMSNRLNDPENGVIVIIMQRVHEDDVSGAILDLGLDYCHLMIPMEFDASRAFDDKGQPVATQIGWVDPRLVPGQPDASDGEPAWLERFPETVIARMKQEVGPYAWAGQYQQMPSPRGGGIFKTEWWQVWESQDGKFPMFDLLIASVDSAFTTNEQNDPTGMTVWGVFNHEGNRRLMLVNAWRKHLAFSGPRVAYEPGESKAQWQRRTQPTWGLMEWIQYTCERFNVDKLLIEAKASGISAAQELRNRYGRQDWSTQLCPTKGDKVARALGVQATFSQLGVYAPVRDWSDMVLQEMAVFPNGKYDDLTDSTTQAVKYLRDIGMAPTDEEVKAEEAERVMHKRQPAPLYPV